MSELHQWEVSRQDDQIKDYFAFEDAGLLANRNGQLLKNKASESRKRTGSPSVLSSFLFFVFFIIGSDVFSNVNPALIELMDGNKYTAYFTKTTKQILSVE